MPSSRRKPCIFCGEPAGQVDYKDVNLLRPFLTDQARIRSRLVSATASGTSRT